MQHDLKPILSFKQGLFSGAPFILVIAPFALLFGVAGTEAGLPLSQVMAMTVIVIAGASQFTALALMQENAPIFIILFTSLVVNLRMAMYSAALLVHFGKAPLWQRALAAYGLIDQAYALTDAKFTDDTTSPWSNRIAFFFGVAAIIAPFWYGFTYVGAVFGARIPESFAIDFGLPITFLAVTGPSLRSIHHVIAAVVASCCALLFHNFPYGLGLISAGMIGILAAMLSEYRAESKS